jgi:hypothetical protein
MFQVALLATNKKICEEATPRLYENVLKFENTTSLNDFLSEHPDTG